MDWSQVLKVLIAAVFLTGLLVSVLVIVLMLNSNQSTVYKDVLLSFSAVHGSLIALTLVVYFWPK
jgi:hypothetical protein